MEIPDGKVIISSRMNAMSFPIASLALSLTMPLMVSGEDYSITVSEHGPAPLIKEVAAVSSADESSRREMQSLWERVRAAFPPQRRSLYGPDAEFVSITLTKGRRSVTIRSWHPLFEGRKDVIVTSRGLETLNGRRREDVMESDEPWYQEARMVFDQVMARAAKVGDSNDVPQ